MIDRLGILRYYTKSPGIGGSVKSSCDDFVVEEVLDDFNCSIGYSIFERLMDSLFFLRRRKRFIHATLVKWGVSTFEAANKLGVNIRYCGLKDRNSFSAQRISSTAFKHFSSRNFFLKNLAYSNTPLTIGVLKGNRFTVTVRFCSGSPDSFINELSSLNWSIPNFFGVQRFGTPRMVNHIVGFHLLKGDFEGAAKIFLTATSPLESDAVYDARIRLSECWPDVKEVKLPNSLFFEKQFIRYSRRNNFLNAFKRLNRTFSLLFLHSFQSYVFNRALSECLIDNAIPSFLELPGYESSLSPVVRDVLDGLNIPVSFFKMRKIRFLRIKGSSRASFMRINDFRVLRENPFKLSFFLGKGSYATVLLDELMK